MNHFFLQLVNSGEDVLVFIMTGPPSRLWSRWCVRSVTGWMKTAPSCTTSTWWSCWPSARRAKTSTPRSSATPCCRWTILSVWLLTKTASLRSVAYRFMLHNVRFLFSATLSVYPSPKRHMKTETVLGHFILSDGLFLSKYGNFGQKLQWVPDKSNVWIHETRLALA